MQTNTAPATLLTDVQLRKSPYDYFTCPQFCSPELAGRLAMWLESEVEWQLHRSDFIDQWECDLLAQKAYHDFDELFSRAALDSLRSLVGGLFGVDLSGKVTVAAHKLIRGQRIGVHNDDPGDSGLETHRLVVQINRDAGTRSGGELLVHSSSDPDDVFETIRPLHNTAFGFAMSPRSYHSVMPMGDWTRYTVIYSFWARESVPVQSCSFRKAKPASPYGAFESATEVAQSLPEPELARLDELINLLQSLGAAGTEHSGHTLLEHLLNTYLILRSWDVSVDVATAGLFHSVYGTHGFATATLGLEQRNALKEIIGSKAEELVFLFGTMESKSLLENLGHSEPYTLKNHGSGERFEISRGVFQNLVILDLANSLEQIGRIQENEQTLITERDLYLQAAEFLPPTALECIGKIYPHKS